MEFPVTLEVLQKCNDLNWGDAYFIQPQANTNAVQFLSDVTNLNRKILGKIYTIFKIGEMLLKLEGFKCASSLDVYIV